MDSSACFRYLERAVKVELSGSQTYSSATSFQALGLLQQSYLCTVRPIVILSSECSEEIAAFCQPLIEWRTGAISGLQ